ncbi:MAG TPA: hypothetical protein VGP26_14310 [Actinophytocola sp.]|jgi:hypothetical protein|nr:hypothetical protein [Actinophytocola sp.]
MAPNHHHRHYDTQDYAADRATRTQRAMQHMPSEDRVDRTDLQGSIAGSQAAGLTPDVRMGDDRVLGDTPHWAGFDSEQLYDFATRDNNPGTADDLGRAFNTGGNGLADAANGLLDAVTRLDGAWSGVAADSARAALAPLASAAGQAGQTAQMMGVQMSRQSLAAAEVRKLPPARKFDQQQSLQAMLAGGPAAMQADLKGQKDAADAVKREQISYLEAYTRAMSAVDAQTPSFVPPPAGHIDPGRGGDARISASPVDFAARHGAPGLGTSTGAPAGGFTGVAPAAGAHGGSTGGAGDLTPPGGPSTTGAAGFVPGTATPVSAPAAPAGGAPHPVGPAAGPGGFGSGFGTAPGGTFGGSGAGGTAAGGGSGTGALGEGVHGGGAGTRGPAAVAAADQGGAGRGAGGMGGASGRRRDEDDDERERPSFLLEGDPESAFGDDQLAAPSVIGTADEDD